MVELLPVILTFFGILCAAFCLALYLVALKFEGEDYPKLGPQPAGWRRKLDKAGTVALVLLLAGAAAGAFLWVAADILHMIEYGRSARGNG